LKWHERLKLSIIEKDYKKLESLLDDMPEFEDMEDLNYTLNLIDEARNTISIEKDEMLKEMQKIQKAKKFTVTHEREKSLDMSF